MKPGFEAMHFGINNTVAGGPQKEAKKVSYTADADQLSILSTSSTLIAENYRPITRPWEAVVKRQADRCSGIVCASIGAREQTIEVGGDCAPDGWNHVIPGAITVRDNAVLC